jgi:hypothetical protein
MKITFKAAVAHEHRLHAKDSTADLPEEVAKRLIGRDLAEEAKASKPPRNEKGLRTDGPTLEEYVKAGYKAETYPPKGYAATPAPSNTTPTASEPPTAAEAPEKPKKEKRE